MRSMKKTKEGVGEEVDANSTSHGAGQDSAEHVKRDQPNVAANISIFDDKEFTTTDECVQYMAETFGFSIPDVEFGGLGGLAGIFERKGQTRGLLSLLSAGVYSRKAMSRSHGECIPLQAALRVWG